MNPTMTLRNSYPPPGTVVFVQIGFVRHVGIVSTGWVNGERMVISSSWRAGCAIEEPWCVFSGGRQVHLREMQPSLSGWIVVERARSLIGKPWHLWRYNCEHFVAEACGEPVESEQLRGWSIAGALILGLGVIAAAAERGSGSASA